MVKAEGCCGSSAGPLWAVAGSAALTENPQMQKGCIINDLELPELGGEELSEELLNLNEGFWGPYRDIPSMATATKKEEILQIVESFAMVKRKHVGLFQRLTATVQRSLELWSAADFALLCRSLGEVGCLHEDLCVAMAPRVTATISSCEVDDLVLLLDAYARTRCHVPSAVEAVLQQTALRLEEFSASQLCLHVSSMARLNICNERLLTSIADKLAEVVFPEDESVLQLRPPFSARDITMAAYSFARLGLREHGVWSTLSRASKPVIRHFTAKELQTLTVALARVQRADAQLLDDISTQAQRRIAQFSAEPLALLLRGFAFLGRANDPLFTRALTQLPRVLLAARPADLVTHLAGFVAAEVRSPFLFDLMTPMILEKAPMFTAFDWLLALRSYAAAPQADEMFLSALELHFKASELSKAEQSEAEEMIRHLRARLRFDSE
ncbi:NLRC3 [Symbiodinium sp. CCMP2592]|nr:NLRC3 [Symbiodinium sp. CCMP2592]